MSKTVLDNYDDFNFMVILLFLYFILVGFIFVIIINAKQKTSDTIITITQSNQYPQTTMKQCVPNITKGFFF